MVGRKVKLAFQQGCRDRKIPAIDIVNKNREGEKENKHESPAAERLSISLRVYSHTFKAAVLGLESGDHCVGEGVAQVHLCENEEAFGASEARI